jgi:hypothetical protein
LNANGFATEGDGPTRAIRGDGPCGSVAAIDPANHVALSVVVDDVAWSELVGVDLGHGCPPRSNTGAMFQRPGAELILMIDELSNHESHDSDEGVDGPVGGTGFCVAPTPGVR